MDFQEYQEQALKTNRIPSDKGVDIMVPLLGLAGESGELLSEYKKYLRDGESHQLFPKRVAEELGDLLWYIANLSSKFNLDLSQIAEANLRKCCDSWGITSSEQTHVYIFDSDFPEEERLPRQFEIEITEVSEDNSIKMRAFINGKQIGNDLTDNSYSYDGYQQFSL